MNRFTLSFTLPPYLAQWFIHKQGGTFPVELTRDQPETDILRRFLMPQPVEPPKPDPTANVTIYIPTFRSKDVRQYNFFLRLESICLSKPSATTSSLTFGTCCTITRSSIFSSKT